MERDCVRKPRLTGRWEPDGTDDDKELRCESATCGRKPLERFKQGDVI